MVEAMVLCTVQPIMVHHAKTEVVHCAQPPLQNPLGSKFCAILSYFVTHSTLPDRVSHFQKRHVYESSFFTGIYQVLCHESERGET